MKMGLLDAKTNCDLALEGVHVEAKLLDMIAEVNVLQFYYNESGLEIEAKYVFPLDSNCAVCDFQAEINGTIIHAQVKEKGEARSEYNEALQRGDGAYLLEKDQPDIFQVLVGNIPPQTRVAIKLTYLVELSVAVTEGEDSASSVQFLLPTAVAPRYTPSYLDRSSSDNLWYSSFTESFHWKKYVTQCDASGFYHSDTLVLRKRPYALSLYIDAEMPSPITKAISPTHQIQTAFPGVKRATVMFVRDAEAMDKDVVIQFFTAKPNQPRAIYEESEVLGGEAAIMLTLVPKFALDELRDSEFIFLVDESGSMSGQKIQSVKNALQLFLRSLPSNSKFNIISFGSTFVPLFPAPVLYTDESIAVASSAISRMNASLGGTEILKPLQFIYQSLRGNQQQTKVQIFVLTDGEVSNTEDIIKEVAVNHKRSNDWRLFTIGVGDSVSHALVDGMARAGNGSSQFIKSGEKIEPKIMAQLKNSLQPALSDVTVDWGMDTTNINAVTSKTDAPGAGCLIGHGIGETASNVIQQAPYSVPPIFSDTRFIVYALIAPHQPIPNQIRLQGNSPDGPLSITLPVEQTKGNCIHKLAARSLIRDLEQGTAGSPQRAREEIIRLGCKYKLISKHTSLIAVEPRQRFCRNSLDYLQNQMTCNLDRVLARGEKIESLLERSDSLSCQSQVFLCRAKRSPISSFVDSVTSWITSWVPSNEPTPLPAASARSIEEQKPSGPTSPKSTGNMLQQIVQHQLSNGSFKPTQEIAGVINVELSKLSQTPNNFAGVSAIVWTTAVIIAFIERNLRDQKAEWELLVEKSRKWVRQQLIDVNPEVNPTDFLQEASAAF